MSKKITRLICGVALAASAIAISSCKVDEVYSGDNIKNTDLTVTLFEDGIQVPLVESTASITVSSLLSDPEINESVSEYLKVDENGKYYLYYSGNASLGETIDDLDLSNVLNISAVNLNYSFKYDLNSFESSDLKVDGVDFEQTITLDDFSSALDADIPQINESVKRKFEIAGSDYDFALNTSNVDMVSTLLSKDKIQTMSSAATIAGKNTFDVNIPDVPVDVAPTTIGPITIPNQIEEIKSIKLNDNARVSVAISLDNSVLSGGTITPNIVIDLSDILVLEGGAGTLDLSSLKLNSPGFTATKEYKVTGVNVAKLEQQKSVTSSGSFHFDNVVASTATANAVQGDMNLKIEVSFKDFEVESVECEIAPIVHTFAQETDFVVNPISLPSQVKEVRSFTFTDASMASVVISATNLSKIKGLNAQVKNMVVEFPADLSVSGEGVANNKLTIASADLTSEIHRNVRIEGLSLNTVDGKIGYSAKVKVAGELVANGSINTSDLPKTSADDVEFVAGLTTNISLKDFDATLNPISQSVAVGPESIVVNLPDEIGNFGTFTIVPEGNPAMNISMNIDDLGSLALSAGANGIAVAIPDIVKFSSIPSGLVYNENTHVLTIPEIKTANYSLPIEKIVVTPVKNSEGKYVVSADYSVNGEVGIPETVVNKATLEAVSGANLSFSASIPTLTAKSISVDELSFDVNKEFDFKIIDAEDIPDMLVGINQVNLTDVVAELNLKLSGLPDIGSGKFVVDLVANLPSFITPSQIALNGEIGSDGKFNKKVNVTGLDLSSYDFQALKAEGSSLSDQITISGRVYAANPSIELNTLSGEFVANVTAKIADSNNKIGVRSLSALVDYQIDETSRVKMFDISSIIPEGSSITLPEVTADINVRTNLAIPASVDVQVFGVTENVVSTGVLAELSLELPYSNNPDVVEEKLNVKNLDVNKILNTRCDSLELHLTGNVDKTVPCLISTEAEYELDIDYEVSIPFAFGAGSIVTYADTVKIGDSSDAIAQVLEHASAGIVGEVENSLPFSLTIECEFLAYDEASDTYRVVPLGKPIRSDVIAAKSTSEINLLIEAGNDTSDYKNITHLRFNASVSSEGSTLAQDDYVKIKDLYLVIPNGVTIDPNQFINNKENE